jgi:hypothetical protein
VVDGQHQNVLVAAQPQQANPNWGALRQVERFLALLGHESSGFPFPLLGLKGGEVNRAEVEDERWSDDLGRIVAHPGEGRSKNLVSSDNLVEGLLKSLSVQVALEPHCARDIVDRVARGELVQKPQALLGKGQGQREIPRAALNAFARRIAGTLLEPVEQAQALFRSQP